MTIADAKRFYSFNKKEYELNTNKEFLSWYNNVIKNGYSASLDIEDLQSLIDNIANWYEIKYPERELEYYEGVIDNRFENIKKISKNMTFEQLMYRLSSKELDLIQGIYRAHGGGCCPIYNSKAEIIGYEDRINIKIKNKRDNKNYDRNYIPDFLVHANALDGKVIIDYYIEQITRNESIHLEELLDIFKYTQRKLKWDYSVLEEVVETHKTDLILRKKILQLVALKLLYSKNTIPERGYERAKRFINEFNKHIDELKLSTSKIDNIMKPDYSDEKVYKGITEEYTKRDSNISSGAVLKRLLKTFTETSK